MNKDSNFNEFPCFAELWGVAIKKYYSESEFGDELISFLNENNINQRNRIADVAAGEGFPSLYLRKKGFNIDCFDLSEDQISTFKKNALNQKVSSEITKSSWLELKNKIKKKYDFIMCRGNSFIYAPGGWNSKNFEKDKSLEIYKETLFIFYHLLSKKGILLIDKFKDSELDHEEKVCEINVLGNHYNLIFSTKLDFDRKERYAALYLDNGKHRKEPLPNLTYALSEPELLKIAKEVGFSKIEKIAFKNEKLFDIFILKKSGK